MLRPQLTRSLTLVPIAFALILTACAGGGGGGNDGGNGGAAPAAVPVVPAAPIVPPVVPPAISAPTITTQPTNVVATAGTSVMFSVVITGGTAPITYQWKRNGVAIGGATSASYTLPATVIGDNAATFSVDVINAAGTLSSSTALLTVTPGTGYGVNTTADLIDDNVNDGVCHTSENTCSLRAAIMTANSVTTPGLTTIYVPAGTYKTTNYLELAGPLGANQSIAIVGAGAGNTIIDGDQKSSVFIVSFGRTATISGVTIRNGREEGIWLRVRGVLTVSDSVIEANRARGILNEGGTLSILNSTIRRNSTTGDGGGLRIAGSEYAESVTTVRNSTISENSAAIGGGGIAVYGERNGLGESAVTLRIVNSTISQNSTNGNGGGIYAVGTDIYGRNSASLILASSTVVGNDADTDRDENGGNGGGIYSTYGTVFYVRNSLFANNTIRNAPIYNDCFGVLTVFGAALFRTIDDCTVALGNPSTSSFRVLNDPDHVVGPLQDNGGPTWTHALVGYEGVDVVPGAYRCYDVTPGPQLEVELSADQRGAPRVSGLACDVGAYERVR